MMSITALYNWRHNIIKALDTQPANTAYLMDQLDYVEELIKAATAAE